MTQREIKNYLTRRSFIGRGTHGVGTFALANILASAVNGADGDIKIPKWTGALDELHHQATAKRVIFLCMAGGMSHLETFDNKPKLKTKKFS